MFRGFADVMPNITASAAGLRAVCCGVLLSLSFLTIKIGAEEAPALLWRDWNEASFAEAQKRQVPIVLWIDAPLTHGSSELRRKMPKYPDQVKKLNDNFVLIRVTREERPDIEARYLETVRVMGGQTGMPMMLALTPDGKMMAGGAFSDFDDDRVQERVGILTTLSHVTGIWKEQREASVKLAASFDAQLDKLPPVWQKPPEPEKKPDTPTPDPKKEGEKPPEPKPVDPPPADPFAKLDALDRVALRMQGSLDREFGGYTGSLAGPKEPTPGLLELALLHSARGEKAEERASSLAACKLTLNAMLRGGIYDRLEGGFHRQTLDRAWRVPCFEKLLEPNAELLTALVHTWQATQDPVFAQAARQTAGWMRLVLYDQDLGVFVAGQSADSFPGDDGSYFTWTIRELELALTDDTSEKLMSDFLGVGEWGELSETAPHRNVLHEDRGLAELQTRWVGKLAPEKIEPVLVDGCKKMLQARRTRVAPVVERMGSVEGNARAISALLLYATVFQDTPAREMAVKVLDRVLVWGVHPKLGAAHVLKKGAAAGELTAGFIGWSVNDAALAWACEEAYLSTGDVKYLDDARERLDFISKHALDPTDGFCWDRHETKGDKKESDPAWPPLLGRLSGRSKPLFDLHSPSVSTQYYLALYRLYALTGKAKKIENCPLLKTLEQNEALELLAGLAPTTFQIRDMIKNGVAMIAIEGSDDDPKTQEFLAEATHLYLPQTWVLRVRPGQNKALELLGVKADDAGTTPRARIWADERKGTPITDTESFRRALEKL